MKIKDANESQENQKFWKMVKEGAQEVESWHPNERASIDLSEMEERKRQSISSPSEKEE